MGWLVDYVISWWFHSNMPSVIFHYWHICEYLSTLEMFSLVYLLFIGPAFCLLVLLLVLFYVWECWQAMHAVIFKLMQEAKAGENKTSKYSLSWHCLENSQKIHERFIRFYLILGLPKIQYLCWKISGSSLDLIATKCPQHFIHCIVLCKFNLKNISPPQPSSCSRSFRECCSHHSLTGSPCLASLPDSCTFMTKVSVKSYVRLHADEKYLAANNEYFTKLVNWVRSECFVRVINYLFS